MEKEWDIIEVLRHSRHDWLNKLQLIKGNLDLKRLDRVKEVIDEIIIEAQHETKLSNLSMPRFAALLLQSNWMNHSFKLEYEIIQELSPVNIDDDLLTDWTTTFFACLDKTLDKFHENNLSITVEIETGGIRFFFDFSGIIVNRELMEDFLESPIQEMVLEVKELSESELTLEIYAPANNA